MVMPFATKKTEVAPGTGPSEINFDILWEKALRPAIEQLGYEPVRADQDVGALIIHEMLERLYFADLVLADITIPNGNVYYEVGIRHASRQVGCVLLAADWSKELFDVAQDRTVRYPLPVGIVDDAAAKLIRDVIEPAIGKMRQGESPMYEVLPGFPGKVDAARASSMRERLAALSGFQARVSAVRAAPGAAHSALLTKLLDETPRPIAPAVAQSLLNLCRDLGAWKEILALVGDVLPEVSAQPQVVELQSLAQSKLGDHLGSIGALEQLIATHGSTSEREGLLGGRYKRLYEAATGKDRIRYLNESIWHYERGMMLDLNDYYPSSNLPRLYRMRGLPDDLAKARSVAEVVYFACQRAKLAGTADEWLRPTMIAAAFDAADVSAARGVCQQVAAEGTGGWKLDSLLDDVSLSVEQVTDPASREALRDVYLQLKELAAG